MFSFLKRQLLLLISYLLLMTLMLPLNMLPRPALAQQTPSIPRRLNNGPPTTSMTVRDRGRVVQPQENFMLKGVDISLYQRQPDFNVLKGSSDFVLIRSAYGNGYTDSQFSRNRDEARRVQLPHGFYHYAYPQYNTAEAEAAWFLNVVGTPQDGEILLLDFEEPSHSDAVAWCKAFLDYLAAHLNGYKPLIYLNLLQLQNYNWKPIIDADYGLWLAFYDYNPNSNNWKTPWPVVAFRQWSDHERVQGIPTVVDADVFYGDAKALYAYGYRG
jgi:GH25 family lysozyme M1 (1,4-beta-N-acetylmuramidase)